MAYKFKIFLIVTEHFMGLALCIDAPFVFTFKNY